jgi:hypothetical protein
MSLLAESQIVELASLVLEIVPVGSVMMENFEEMLRGRVEEKTRAKYAPAPFMGTCVRPTSDQLKLVDFPELPFMPSVIHYIGCKAIKYAGGLMTPCGGKVKNNDFCVTCLKRTEKHGGAHEYGTLDEREDAYDEGKKYSAGGKTEISFGDYLVAKKKTREEAKQAIRQAGLSINIPEECFTRSSTDKKRSGRPAKKAEGSVDTDEAVEAPKPKVKKPAVKLTLEEKLEATKREYVEKEKKAEERALKQAENKAKKAIEEEEKAQRKAEREAKKKDKEQLAAAVTKKTKENMKEILANVDETQDDQDEAEADSVGSLSEQEEEEEEVETFAEKSVRGFDYTYSIKTWKVFSKEDEEHTVCVGVYDTDKCTVDFYTTKPARCIIEEMLQHDIEKFDAGDLKKDKKGKALSNFIIKGKRYCYNHEAKSKKIYSYDTNEVFWVLNEDGKLSAPPADDDE